MIESSKFLTAIRTKGGVVNIHVVRATTAILIKTNPTYTIFFQSREIISKGWKKAGLLDGTTVLPAVDPFECIAQQYH